MEQLDADFVEIDQSSMPIALDQNLLPLLEEEDPQWGPELLASALIIKACKQRGKWCGVSVLHLNRLLQDLNREGNELVEQHDQARKQEQRAELWNSLIRFLLLVMTFGLASFFLKPPKPRPFSANIFYVYMGPTPAMLEKGINLLLSQEKAVLVRRKVDGNVFVIPRPAILGEFGQQVAETANNQPVN